MTWPHPIVGVATKLADAAGGGTHQTNIFVNHVNRENELIPVKNGTHIALVALLFGGGLIGDDFANLGDHRTALGFGNIAKGIIHPVGHILHTNQGRGGESGVGQFLGAVHGPEAVGQIIFLNRAMVLNQIVGAVVVGEHQTLVRNDFGRTKTAA